MKNKMNIWYWGYIPKYYLVHPWKWFKELGSNIKNAYDRITKGYCCLDWFDLDMWFKYIMPSMLREMAINGHAYPGSEPFETPEKWRSWLIRMAEQLEYCQDEDNGNEYAKPYVESLMKNPQSSLFGEKTEEKKELFNKYYKRSLEVMEEQKKLFKDTMEELLEHWDCLWD